MRHEPDAASARLEHRETKHPRTRAAYAKATAKKGEDVEGRALLEQMDRGERIPAATAAPRTTKEAIPGKSEASIYFALGELIKIQRTVQRVSPGRYALTSSGREPQAASSPRPAAAAAPAVSAQPPPAAPSRPARPKPKTKRKPRVVKVELARREPPAAQGSPLERLLAKIPSADLAQAGGELEQLLARLNAEQALITRALETKAA